MVAPCVSPEGVADTLCTFVAPVIALFAFSAVVQGASSPDPSQVYVDMRALRNDRVTLVERGAPHSLCLLESGKLLPGLKLVIANPDTRGQCGDSHLGEVRGGLHLPTLPPWPA